MNELKIKTITRLVVILEVFQSWMESIGLLTLRYGLSLILIWIGAMKFTAYEADGIRPFVENSPFFSWIYPLLGVQGMSNLLGSLEILIGLLMASRPWMPGVSSLASLVAAGMFVGTLSFLVTTPEAWVSDVGFPKASLVGQFLIKDIALLGTALVCAAEAGRASLDFWKRKGWKI